MSYEHSRRLPTAAQMKAKSRRTELTVNCLKVVERLCLTEIVYISRPITRKLDDKPTCAAEELLRRLQIILLTSVQVETSKVLQRRITFFRGTNIVLLLLKLRKPLRRC